MNEYIKQTLNTKGWEEIEQILLQEFVEGRKAINIRTEGKSNEQIATDVKAREYSAKTIKRFLSRMNRIKNDEIEKKESYR